MQHPDEGTIHAWLDDALAPEEARAIEEHVGACPTCAAAVAEARGLIAASSRILARLDDVPGGVTIPGKAGQVPVRGRAARSGPAPRRWLPPQYAAAAAVLLVAVGTWATIRGSSSSPAREAATETALAIAADSAASPPALTALEANRTAARAGTGTSERPKASEMREETRDTARTPAAKSILADQVSTRPDSFAARARVTAVAAAAAEQGRMVDSARRAAAPPSVVEARARDVMNAARSRAMAPMRAERSQAEIDSVVNVFAGCYTASRSPRALDDGFPARVSLLNQPLRRVGTQQTWIASPENSVPTSVTWEWTVGVAFNVTLQRVAGGPALTAEFAATPGVDLVLQRMECR